MLDWLTSVWLAHGLGVIDLDAVLDGRQTPALGSWRRLLLLLLLTHARHVTTAAVQLVSQALRVRVVGDRAVGAVAARTQAPAVITA